MAALRQEKQQRTWIVDEVNKHYLEFTNKRNVNLFVGTWNVNAKEPKDDITSWLIDDDSKFNADIYVLGFQEIVDLNASNLFIEHTANEGWERVIEQVLATSIPNTEFVKLDSRHLVGILLCIYVRKSLRPYIKNVMTTTLGVGLFGTAGNKGGVGTRMQLFDSDICFICTHLAAHKNNVQGRNQDYLKILEQLAFNPNGDAADASDEMKTNAAANDASQKQNDASQAQSTTDEEEDLLSVLYHHDMVFWLGDLNYRLNFELLEEVFDKIKEEDWTYLLHKDQLQEERAKGRAFDKFVEPQITYQPTYKFQPGTDEYEQRPDKKKRMPAWCDRVLWRKGHKKTSNVGDVQCLKYAISPQQKISDHKPVFAHLQYAANVFDMKKRKTIKDTIMKNRDNYDNNQLPQIDINPDVAFPLIKFGEPQQQEFVINNTGNVAVSYRFTHGLDTPSMPKWLRVLPNRGVIRPGDRGKITFEILVTSEVVRSITNKLKADILLKIENISDDMVPIKIVTVTANYLPSCFGNKIENLVKYRKPIRFIEDLNDMDLDRKQIKKQIKRKLSNGNLAVNNHHVQSASNNNGGGGNNSGNSSSPNNNDDDDDDDDEYSTSIETTLSIPKELWRLIDHLHQFGMQTEHIFIQRGITSEISEIRECLDTGKPFTKYELHSVGEALVRFLESLQDPVFPASLCESYKEKEMEITQWSKFALMRLPLSHYNTFVYIISFLREVLKYQSKNKLTAETLAYQFSSALMQTSVKDTSNLAQFKPFQILRHFLSSDLFL